MNDRCSAPPRVGAANSSIRVPIVQALEPTLKTTTTAKVERQNQAMTSISRFALITVVGTLAYLGLAILGWGGFAAFFSHPALVALVTVYFVLFGIALFSGSNLSPGVRNDPADRWVVAAFWWIGLLAAYLPAYTDRNGFWTFDTDAIRWLGVFLFAAGGALRIWPVFVLGHRFSGLVAIQPQHSLVTSGVYGIIRHPSYLGLLVSSLGWALAFRSGIGVLLMALTIPLFLVRIRAEESFLRSEFGRDYDVYCGGTSRLIPRVY
jgi:protein-S-isoprenylcysteine O-methyltransferase Ste14